ASTRPGTASGPPPTASSASLARERSAHQDSPVRSTPAAIRTSCRSGWRIRYSTPSAPSGIAASASGGTTIRSTSTAVPCTVSGQASWASRSSSVSASGSPSWTIAVRCSGSEAAPSGSSAAISGLVATRSEERTREYTAIGASQPCAATCRSTSRTASARAAVRAESSVSMRLWSQAPPGVRNFPVGPCVVAVEPRRVPGLPRSDHIPTEVLFRVIRRQPTSRRPHRAPTPGSAAAHPAGDRRAGVLFLILSRFWTEWLWYDQLGYTQVIRTEWITRAVLFVLGAAVMGGAVWLNLHLAYRNRPMYVPTTTQQQDLVRYREIGRWASRGRRYQLMVV